MSKSRNIHNLKTGDSALIDIDMANGGYTVTVVSVSRIFAKVRNSDGREWLTMINRLTPITSNEYFKN